MPLKSKKTSMFKKYYVLRGRNKWYGPFNCIKFILFILNGSVKENTIVSIEDQNLQKNKPLSEFVHLPKKAKDVHFVPNWLFKKHLGISLILKKVAYLFRRRFTKQRIEERIL